MLLLNFAHPITGAQHAQIEALAGRPIGEARHYPVQFDLARPFAGQVRALVEQVGLTPEQWQSEALLINPPTLSVLAAALLAELHGRMGHFPAVLRLKPAAGSIPQFEVAEIINLDAIRAGARQAR